MSWLRPLTGGKRPRVAFRPTRPQKAAGKRVEPPPSEDMLIGVTPAATSAPEPPDEPPAVRSRCQGLRVTNGRPRYEVLESSVSPNSGVVARPSGMRPAASALAT